MKLIIVLTLVALAVARPDGDTYDAKYENIDVDEIINNERLLKAYCDCFLGVGKCTPEGTDFNKTIPEAISTSCAKCTDKHKALIAKFIKAIKTKLPDKFEALSKKHDPESKNAAELQKFLEQYAP